MSVDETTQTGQNLLNSGLRGRGCKILIQLLSFSGVRGAEVDAATPESQHSRLLDSVWLQSHKHGAHILHRASRSREGGCFVTPEEPPPPTPSPNPLSQATYVTANPLPSHSPPSTSHTRFLSRSRHSRHSAQRDPSCSPACETDSAAQDWEVEREPRSERCDCARWKAFFLSKAIQFFLFRKSRATVFQQRGVRRIIVFKRVWIKRNAEKIWWWSWFVHVQN